VRPRELLATLRNGEHAVTLGPCTVSLMSVVRFYLCANKACEHVERASRAA
jgi:hypothetical protein